MLILVNKFNTENKKSARLGDNWGKLNSHTRIFSSIKHTKNYEVKFNLITIIIFVIIIITIIIKYGRI